MKRAALFTTFALVVGACSSARTPVLAPTSSGRTSPSAPVVASSPARPANVYAGAITTTLSASVANITPRVYVPNAVSDTVDVIDPKTFTVIDHFVVGKQPQHVTPSYDMRTLFVDEVYEGDGALLAIDPFTGKPGKRRAIRDPYNLYYTPDGSKAIVVAERYNSLDFRDPVTWKVLKRVHIPSSGVDHMDFTADGRFLLASTEYGGVVVKVDTVKMEVAGTANVGGLPVDVKVSPDGSVFFVANQGARSGVSVIDPKTMKVVQFIPALRGAHGFALSRNGRYFYMSNRTAGAISILDPYARKIIKVWHVGGSPDMLQVSPDGTQLWYSNRYNGYVSVLDTRTGERLARINTGTQPHGLCYFPQPGRFSLGHNGVYR